MRANCESIELRQRARERGLADARIVLDEDVALGEHRDDDVLEHLVAHLDRAADVLLHALGDRGRLLDLLGPDGVGTTPLDWLHQLLTFTSEDERRLNTASRTFAATAALVARGTCVLAVRGDDRDLVVGRVERDTWRGDVVDDDGVEALALELVARVRDRAGRRDSAAKPTSSWPGRRSAASAAEDVLGALELERERLPRVGLLDLVRARVGRAVVGDGGGHQQDVGGSGSARGRRRRARRRCATSTYSMPGARGSAHVGGDDGDLARRGARPPRRAPSPSARSCGCRRSARRRSARACRRR